MTLSASKLFFQVLPDSGSSKPLIGKNLVNVYLF